MKILFVINSLEKGGAEKVLLNLVKNLDKRLYDVTVLSVSDKGIYIPQIRSYATYKYIIKMYKGKCVCFRKIVSGIARIHGLFLRYLPAELLYKYVIKENYDVEIAFLEGWATKIISGSHSSTLKIAWVHTDMVKNHWSLRHYYNAKQEREAYCHFDKIISVSDSVRDAFSNSFSRDTLVLYNPIDEYDIIEKSKELEVLPPEPDVVRFIVCGRLEPVKGYERLLQCIKRLIDDKYQLELWIVGEGRSKHDLYSYVKNNGLSNSVRFLGFKENPYPYMQHSNCFICSSYAEGYSGVIAEALILGIPVISTECAGTKELLGESEYGIICENSIQGLYTSIKAVLESKELRIHLSSMALMGAEKIKIKQRIKNIEELFSQ